MSPRLVIVAGPSRGAQVALETDEVALGRDSSCGVCLPDAALSRRHALLERSPDGWRIRDLGSLNGLRVNGLPTAEHLLSDGDRIELGVSVLVFRPEPEGAEGGAEEAAEVVSTIRVPVSQAVWAGDAAALASRKVERSLGLLLAAGRRFAAERTVEGLAKALLSSSRDVAGGTSGAVLVPDDGNGLREVAAAQGTAGSPRVPVGAAAEALERREAVALGLDGLHGAAIPILNGEERLGVLCLVGSDASLPEDDLQLLFGLCASAGASLALVKHLAWLDGERRRLEAASGDEELRGDSPSIARVRALLARAAGSEASVLLAGESGTGKELAARALHARSGRSGGPFVAVNAAALVDTLVESELFGHERGAFTGAVARRRGRLEMAHRGTLFLDEVGEMAPQTQAKLLRVLETRSFERVGGTESVKIDVRVIAATNRDLAESVAKGAFRSDLYYRLNVVPITIPPLRDRRDDIMPLAKHFLEKYSTKMNKGDVSIAPDAMKLLLMNSWPGNVRELENTIERSLALCGDSKVLRPSHIPQIGDATGPLGAIAPGGASLKERLKAVERHIVVEALTQTGWRVTRAAELLAVTRQHLHNKMREYSITAP